MNWSFTKGICTVACPVLGECLPAVDARGHTTAAHFPAKIPYITPWDTIDRLADALQRRAFSAINTSPGARRYYDRQGARDAGCNPALRQLGSRLVGILHGCLKTRALYDESTAWSHHATIPAAAARTSGTGRSSPSPHADCRPLHLHRRDRHVGDAGEQQLLQLNRELSHGP
ncbi:hypothetical protein ACWF95_37615 [Streptomyces vinaceus]